MRVEVELKVASSPFAIIHVGHKKAPLAHFSKTRKAPAAPTVCLPRHRKVLILARQISRSLVAGMGSNQMSKYGSRRPLTLP
ncbi:hypothetical protein [Streptomyces sp. NPDC002209]|uniref:hypothetical protein n=1 Tax=Streptomyces sp. NPDC002209 TaxID=3364638 RepID=UPI00369874C6